MRIATTNRISVKYDGKAFIASVEFIREGGFDGKWVKEASPCTMTGPSPTAAFVRLALHYGRMGYNVVTDPRAKDPFETGGV